MRQFPILKMTINNFYKVLIYIKNKSLLDINFIFLIILYFNIILYNEQFSSYSLFVTFVVNYRFKPVNISFRALSFP